MLCWRCPPVVAGDTTNCSEEVITYQLMTMGQHQTTRVYIVVQIEVSSLSLKGRKNSTRGDSQLPAIGERTT